MLHVLSKAIIHGQIGDVVRSLRRALRDTPILLAYLRDLIRHSDAGSDQSAQSPPDVYEHSRENGCTDRVRRMARLCTMPRTKRRNAAVALYLQRVPAECRRTHAGSAVVGGRNLPRYPTTLIVVREHPASMRARRGDRGCAEIGPARSTTPTSPMGWMTNRQVFPQRQARPASQTAHGSLHRMMDDRRTIRCDLQD